MGRYYYIAKILKKEEEKSWKEEAVRLWEKKEHRAS